MIGLAARNSWAGRHEGRSAAARQPGCREEDPATSCATPSGPERSPACHDVSDGGIAVTVAEMRACERHRRHARSAAHRHGGAEATFAEDQGLYVVTVRDAALTEFLNKAEALGIEVDRRPHDPPAA